MEPILPTLSVQDVIALGNEPVLAPTTRSTDLTGRDEFLNLLVVQLRHQDPLNPMNSQEFAVQLSQFSQVEQLLNIREAIDAGRSTNESVAQILNSLMTTSLLGKDVIVLSGGFLHQEGEESVLEFDVPEDAANLTITIENSVGEVVDVVEFGPGEAGMQSAVWDGRDSNDALFTSGRYAYRVEGVNADNGEIVGRPHSRGRVTGVTSQSGTPMLIVNGTPVSIGLVLEILEPGN